MPTNTEYTKEYQQWEAINNIRDVQQKRSELDGEIKAWEDLLEQAVVLFKQGNNTGAEYLRDLAQWKLKDLEAKKIIVFDNISNALASSIALFQAE